MQSVHFRNNRSWRRHDWNCRQSPFQMAGEVLQKCFSVLLPPGILSLVWLMFVYLRARWISASLLDAMTFKLSLKNCRCHRSRTEAQNRFGFAVYAAGDKAWHSFYPHSSPPWFWQAESCIVCLYRVWWQGVIVLTGYVQSYQPCVWVLEASPLKILTAAEFNCLSNVWHHAEVTLKTWQLPESQQNKQHSQGHNILDKHEQ